MSGTPAPSSALAAPLVEVTRRDVHSGREVVESVHLGHLVLVDEDGSVEHHVGDAHAVVFPRSAVKPLQAAACLELIGEADAQLAAALTDVELAVGWASHRAEPEQLAAVRALLARAGASDAAVEEVLTCPRADVPDDRTAPRSHLAHNCSGKHALFALTARTLGLGGDRASVLDADGQLQTHVRAAVAARTGPEQAVGVDGCGAPAIAVPLSGLARAFAAAAVTSDPALARVRDAGLAHPLLVGGSERRGREERVPVVDSALLAAGVVAKRGAEGVLAAGWRGADGRGRGAAVKTLDGSMRGAATALVALLEAAGVVPAGTWREAAPRGGGQVAGTVRASALVLGGTRA